MQATKEARLVVKAMSNENSVPLENGRVIAFEEYGDATGVPVIFVMVGRAHARWRG